MTFYVTSLVKNRDNYCSFFGGGLRYDYPIILICHQLTCNQYRTWVLILHIDKKYWPLPHVAVRLLYCCFFLTFSNLIISNFNNDGHFIFCFVKCKFLSGYAVAVNGGL